ncbi:hypothetical protein KFL_001760010 [Klebsormidium nitens]|uniref:Uncharacterized protein n=1 Tax=Klebsormidium nitens TaxID=105231 RepID=A0A1Y1I0V9_KLENI|nr:hypothetical protein KFL_001760010 [Klebsormidium nitens]|eukprot:GAQ84093.1 hypothetical protein KFL_001760010 [Klebsormidium nitens]
MVAPVFTGHGVRGNSSNKASGAWAQDIANREVLQRRKSGEKAPEVTCGRKVYPLIRSHLRTMAPTLFVRMLILVTLYGCGPISGVHPFTIEEMGNLTNENANVLASVGAPSSGGQGPVWNLSKIDLAYTRKLSGPIPPELGSLTNLTWLSLVNHALSGPIPPELAKLTKLTFLDLSANNLSGPIPPELSSLTNLTVLELSGNRLSGSIPPQLGSLTKLTWLSLHSNNLSGPIPRELGNLTKVDVVYLNNNTLSGPIPPELGRLTNVTYLSLNNNTLSGPIPPELGKLTDLYALKLSENNLSGPIPRELGKAIMTRLYVLELSNNSLSGPIPLSLSRFRNTTFYPGNSGLCCTDCSANFSSPCPPGTSSSCPSVGPNVVGGVVAGAALCLAVLLT